MKILIFGSTGFAGSDLVRRCNEDGIESVGIARGENPEATKSEELDLVHARQGDLERLISRHTPDAVIYGSVAPTQAPKGVQRKVNSEAVSKLADACRNAGSPKLVYISTDAVFGDTPGPHRERDKPAPGTTRDVLVDYALSKTIGEGHVLAYAEGIVARTAHVNGVEAGGGLSPRLADCVDKLRSGETYRRLCDQKMSPTLRDNLSECLLEICQADFQYRGVVHVVGREVTTPFAFCQSLAAACGLNPNQVVECKRSDSPTTERLPGDTSLSSDFTATVLSTPLLNVEDQIHSIRHRANVHSL